MGLGGIAGLLMGGGGQQKQSGPSAAELQAAQNAAAQTERDRIAQEQAKAKADTEAKAVADLQSAESQRRAFAGSLAGEEDDEQRRKFLKGA